MPDTANATVSNDVAAAARGVALVTGASHGLGACIARRLAQDGWNLVVTARTLQELGRLRDELEARYGSAVDVVAADLAHAEGVEALVAAVDRLGVAVDVLVNNAGAGSVGPMGDGAWTQEAARLHLDVIAPTRLMHRLLPGMLERGRGTIVNIASTAALRPSPWMSVYGAGKAYLVHLSESLAAEAAGRRVRVIAICPGPTATRFREAAGLRPVDASSQASAESVADFVVRAMQRPGVVFVHGWRQRAQTALIALLPRTLQASLVSRRRRCG